MRPLTRVSPCDFFSFSLFSLHFLSLISTPRNISNEYCPRSNFSILLFDLFDDTHQLISTRLKETPRRLNRALFLAYREKRRGGDGGGEFESKPSIRIKKKEKKKKARTDSFIREPPRVGDARRLVDNRLIVVATREREREKRKKSVGKKGRKKSERKKGKKKYKNKNWREGTKKKRRNNDKGWHGDEAVDNERIATCRTNNYYRASVRERSHIRFDPGRKYESEIRERQSLVRGRYSHNRTANRIIALRAAIPDEHSLYRVSLVSPIIRVVC